MEMSRTELDSWLAALRKLHAPAGAKDAPVKRQTFKSLRKKRTKKHGR